MATVVFNDGNATGIWSDILNWIGGALPLAADTADIDANCILDMSDIVAAIDWGANTFTMNQNCSLTGMTSNAVGAGNFIMADGCNFTFNTITDRSMPGCVASINGTTANVSSVTNVGGGKCGLSFLTGSIIKGCDFSTRTVFINTDSDGIIIFEDCWFVWDSTTLEINLVLRRCFLTGGAPELPIGYPGWENIVVGYKRDGAASGIGNFNLGRPNNSCMYTPRIYNCVLNASSLTNKHVLFIDNLGHVDPSMLPGTGSDLDLAVVGPGTSKMYYAGADSDFAIGTIERSTLAKKTGDYGLRAAPLVACSDIKYLDSSFHIPIVTGDNIAVSIYGRRHTMTDDCAEVELDPEGAWFTPTISAPAMTNADTWYEFTPSANGAGGTAAKGAVRIVLRLKEYEAAGYCDWADAIIDVTHADATVTRYLVSMQDWANGMPTVSKPDHALIADVKKDIPYNNGNKVGTYDPITGQYTDPGKANVLVGSDYTFAGAPQVAEFDEAARNTDPGEALVFLGTNYKIQNAAKVGSFPEAARNTDPGESNVLTGTPYKILDVVKGGTFDEAVRNIDPGESNVLIPTPYKILNVDKEGTLPAGGGAALGAFESGAWR